jgi:hypothetical protein
VRGNMSWAAEEFRDMDLGGKRRAALLFSPEEW